MRREARLFMRVVDRPRRHAQTTLIVPEVAGKERRFGRRPEADAPRGMTRSVHDREAREDVTILEEPRLATGAGQDIADETRREPIRHPPEGHPLARAAGPQVGRIV